MASSFARPTVLRRERPSLLISSSLLSHPPKILERRSETLLSDLDVGVIVNVASDVQKNEHHDKLYRRLSIRYLSLPIDDNDDLASDFLDNIVALYKACSDRRCVLINCAMGINRSALAAGALLWHTSSTQWSSPEHMVEYMRTVQREDRGVLLLTNATFERALIEWCRRN